MDSADERGAARRLLNVRFSTAAVDRRPLLAVSRYW